MKDKIEERNKILVPLAQAGDVSAMNELYEINKAFLENFLRKTVKCAYIREEVTHLTLTNMLYSLSSYTYNCKFTTYICRIAINLYVDQLRKNEFEKFDISNRYEIEVYPENDFAERDEENHIRKIVLDKINLMKGDDMKLVLKLRLIDDYTIKQISEETGFTKGKVKQLISRGKAKLRTHQFSGL